MALKKNKSVEINWRGIKETVEPGGPEFTTADLRGRLFVALQAILKNNGRDNFQGQEQKVR